MKNVGLTAPAMPRAKPGDYERALALMAATGADKGTKAYLIELQDATLADNAAREAAETAQAEAKRCEGLAREAEADARSQRASFATETAETDRRLTAERGELATERMRLGEWTKESEARETDLNLREAALRRAFDAYQGETR